MFHFDQDRWGSTLLRDFDELSHMALQRIAIRAVAMARREKNLGTAGPACLGILALATDDPAVRRDALAEAEALLARPSYGHNYLWFYHDAIETTLAEGVWTEALRYAAALEDYTRAEPLPWAEFYVARGRALAAWGHGAHDPATAETLRRLCDQARSFGLAFALPALERTLADGDAAIGSPTI